MHQRAFYAITKKIHTAAMKAESENLNQARAVTKQSTGKSDVEESCRSVCNSTTYNAGEL